MILRLAQLVDHPYPLSLKSTGQPYASGSLIEHLGVKLGSSFKNIHFPEKNSILNGFRDI